MDTTAVDKNNNIIELYGKFIKALENNADKINDDPKLKYICGYSIVLFDYGMDIATLKQSNRNASIEPLSRDLLECYAVIKNLISRYANDNKFNEYVKFLLYEDMSQDRSIYFELKTDNTFIDVETKNKQLNGILMQFKKTISEYFPDEAKNIALNDLATTVFYAFKNIKTQYSNKFQGNKTIRFGDAIKDNEAWTRENKGISYEGSFTVYRTMCHLTHNTISSISERTIRSGYAMFNTESRNILPALCLDFWCLKEVYEELDILFQ